MRDDALPFGRILAFGAAIAAGVVLAAAVALAIPRMRALPAGGLPVAPPAPPPADQPALQSAPQRDLGAYRLQPQRKLHGLGWIDAASGVAHVPIELAMALRVRAASEASR